MFSEGAAQSNFDAVLADIQRYASNAQQFYMKPSSLGGGGMSFSALTFPNGAAVISNTNGSYTLTNLAVGSFDITGVGTQDGDSDGTNITVTLSVYPDSVSSTPTITSR
ncbi:MAG: hypothetical protein GY863_00800 [bacterium]|nr:hypothetical protein [bacterium]